MNFDYKKYPVTAGVIGICILVYCYTTVKYGFEMNAYQGIRAGGLIQFWFWQEINIGD